ncbi:MAG: PAS domain S-box protein [Terriglobales bacterium]|jgi:two-component system, cell cycle sensor histidine kinase and response regulator CckA
MGDKITRPALSVDQVRARFLREALHNGEPVLSAPEVGAGVVGEPVLSHLDSESPELQKAYLEQLVECAPEAISILDTQMRITRLNGEFSRVFGYRPEEALGRRLEELIVPPDRSTETRWIEEKLAKGKKVVLETKRQHKDGSLVDVLISSAPVVVGGKQVGVCALYRDISEQKRAEALSSALLRIAEKASSPEDLQQFYGAIHSIVAELMYARNFYVALYDAESQLLSFPYFVDDEDPRPAPKKLGKGLTEQVLRTGEPLLCTPDVFEELVQREAVELIGAASLDWLGVPLKVGGNTFGALVVQSYTGNVRFGEKEKEILTFVSQQVASAVEHRRNEEALRRSEARYRSVVQSAVYGIYRSSLEGKFLDVNPALVTMLGYGSATQVLGLEPKRDVFVDAGELSRLLREFRGEARPEHIEVRWKRKDEKVITVRLSGRIVHRPEESAEVFEMIAEDVTEQRLLENQFRQAQKMEAVGRLAGGVAHDFNNLLMVIGGYTEVLLENTGKNNGLYPKIEAIHHATERAAGLTRQLLAFSRKQLLELKVVDLNVIVGDMGRLLRPLIGESIELETVPAADLGRTRADAGQIEQVIMNLVVNSKDAMPEGGRLTIRTANANLGGDDLRREHSYIQPGAYVMLSVSDNGHGMDKETQARIFEPFFTTKEKGKGTGLGLSTVYGIIKQSGGYVLVQSEAGQGTTFRIYLPRVEESAEPVGTVRISQPQHGGSETVLLVEDEESVRQLVRETLEAKGYTVLEAENGERALHIVTEHSEAIDMLITDVVMPGMSGRELSARLCATHPQTKVLYLSGYTEDAIVHEGVLEAGTAFLQKPFTLQMLSRKVREVLGSERRV